MCLASVTAVCYDGCKAPAKTTGEKLTMLKVTVTCKPCVFCGKINKLDVSAKSLWAWQNGAHIQNAMPELTADEREMLISGTCSKCWDENMNFDEDD